MKHATRVPFLDGVIVKQCKLVNTLRMCHVYHGSRQMTKVDRIHATNLFSWRRALDSRLIVLLLMSYQILKINKLHFWNKSTPWKYILDQQCIVCIIYSIEVWCEVSGFVAVGEFPVNNFVVEDVLQEPANVHAFRLSWEKLFQLFIGGKDTVYSF